MLAMLARGCPATTLHISEDSLQHGLLGLVVAVIEIVRDALKLEALRRVDEGSLTEEEVDRLGRALMDLDRAIAGIKEDQGIAEAVKSVRDGLDRLVDDVLDRMLEYRQGEEETREG